MPTDESKLTHVAPLTHFDAPDRRFASVCVDIVGPLNEYEYFSYILTVVNRFIRRPEAIPLRNITARSCADAFSLNWVARFSCPTEISKDRGRQFTSVIWDKFSFLLGSKHLTTTVYRSACGGLVQRFNKSLKVALRVQDERLIGIQI